MASRKSNPAQSRRARRAAKGGGADATAARLQERARRAEREAAAEPEPAEAAAAANGAATLPFGGLQIPNLQLGNMEGTVRNVMKYVQENPLAAAAMAVGAGVMLTSMYWDQSAAKSGGRRRR